MVKKKSKIDNVKDRSLSSKGCKTEQVGIDSEATVLVSIEVEADVHEMNDQIDKQNSECKQEMSHG